MKCFPADPADPLTRPVRWIVELPLADEGALAGRETEVVVEGTLTEIDPYLRRVTLADGRRMEGR